MIVYYFDDEVFNPKFSLTTSDTDTNVLFEVYKDNEIVKTETVFLYEYDYGILGRILELYSTLDDTEIIEMLQLLFNNKLKTFQI